MPLSDRPRSFVRSLHLSEFAPLYGRAMAEIVLTRLPRVPLVSATVASVHIVRGGSGAQQGKTRLLSVRSSVGSVLCGKWKETYPVVEDAAPAGATAQRVL